MREARLGSIWPDNRPAIVHGQDLDRETGRARPGWVLPERAGAGGGVDIEGLRFDENLPGELVLAETYPAHVHLVEDLPGELVLDDTVNTGLKIRATADNVFVSD